MAPSTKNGKKATGTKKEKLFHPQSRKAGQLVRTQLRKSKLVEQSKERFKKQGSQGESCGELTLEELHYIVREIWLARFDQELEAEKAARRKGRPKSVKEQKLEEQKLRESELYRTGMEVVDLTLPTNVELFRKWDQTEAAYVQQLRFIRISSASPETVVLSRAGHHALLKREESRNAASEPQSEAQEENMDTDDAPLLLEPPSRFASTIQTMDGI
ncbi:hypothetical protein C8Q80DRAFT_1221771 [Daedaleopsis nitida]|nr:hypothetical protein C8Q80DRAFT_1221771 [Daedaleopsis nitida]